MIATISRPRAFQSKNKSLATLVDLAARINAAHDQAAGALRSGLEHARRAGELLIEAKARVPHGQWLPWLAVSVSDGRGGEA